MAERKRCAIYTRKSTEEGLEQNFNSLDAQREACAAYVMSQTHEGWELIAEHYDDGGWSGGNMDRPGLKQLLADVAAGKVDVIVVYKVDRLTRSLADFARIVESLDRAGASFVSVTQAFNTTTSMGRLTLNVLLSFAQFEREVTSERIRDKVAASKRKGMWMGGPVPIGYRLENRKLIVDEGEAATVRLIFERYVALRSIGALVDDLAGLGVRTKLRTYQGGRKVGGVAFTTGPVSYLLRNPIYLGKVRHRGQLHDGEHPAIIDQQLWDAVQSVLAANGRDRKFGRKLRAPSLLVGILTDPEGRPMRPSHTTRSGKRYRYYVTRLAPGENRSSVWRLPAGELEGLVITKARDWLLTDGGAARLQDAPDIAEALSDRRSAADKLPAMSRIAQRAALLELGARIHVKADTVEIHFHAWSENPVVARVKSALARKGSELRLTIPPDDARDTEPDPVLLRLVAHARAAESLLVEGKPAPGVNDYSKAHLHRLLRLAWLAPDILSAIVEGRQPVSLTGRRLLRAARIPLDWAEQRRLFGFA